MGRQGDDNFLEKLGGILKKLIEIQRNLLMKS